jgi:hypothetical protein
MAKISGNFSENRSTPTFFKKIAASFCDGRFYIGAYHPAYFCGYLAGGAVELISPGVAPTGRAGQQTVSASFQEGFKGLFKRGGHRFL